MNKHAEPDTFRPIGERASKAVAGDIVEGMAEAILTLAVPLSDRLRVAAGLIGRGFRSTEVNEHINAAIAQVRAMRRQAT